MAEIVAKPRNTGPLLRELAERIGDWLHGVLLDAAEHSLVWPTAEPSRVAEPAAQRGRTADKTA